MYPPIVGFWGLPGENRLIIPAGSHEAPDRKHSPSWMYRIIPPAGAVPESPECFAPPRFLDGLRRGFLLFEVMDQFPRG